MNRGGRKVVPAVVGEVEVKPAVVRLGVPVVSTLPVVTALGLVVSG